MLNTAQKQAVNCDAERILCLAGAGTGKTHCMISRISRLVDNLNVDTSSILVLTFTNAAACEMKERYRKVHQNKTTPTFCTFHSFCYSLISDNREMARYLGYYKGIPQIADDIALRKIHTMQEDAHNTVLVLKNYGGEDLGEFRQNLATYHAVKVYCDGDSNGGVETLQVQVNSENYKAIIELFKKAIIENGMGYDAKDDRLSGNPNQMNIQSMYSDIDLDANDMETELQASFEEILWFVNTYLANTGQGDFEDAEVNVIFNRDILVNETESIANCAASVGILSDETIIGQHPWIDDPQLEIERLKQQEKQQNYDPFGESNEEQRVLEKPL